MEEIGLFPLGLVLLPTEQVPLHIFEPRYRELIAECVEGEQPFGLVFADDDGLRRTGTLASVVEVVERFEDGRLNIVVEGGDRFRLLELTDGRSFHTGTVEPLADNDDPPDPADVTRGIGLFAQLVELTRLEIRARPRAEAGASRGDERARAAEAALRDPRDGRHGRPAPAGDGGGRLAQRARASTPQLIALPATGPELPLATMAV